MLSTMRAAATQHGRMSNNVCVKFTSHVGEVLVIRSPLAHNCRSAGSSTVIATRRSLGIRSQYVGEAWNTSGNACGGGGSAPSFTRRARPHVTQQSAGRPRLLCSEAEGSKKPVKGFEKFHRESVRRDAKKPDGTRSTEVKDKKASNGPSAEQRSPKGQAEGGREGKEAKTEKRGDGKGNKGETSGKGPKIPEAQMTTILSVAFGVGLVFALLQGSDGTQREVTMQEMLREYLMKGHVAKIQIVNKSFCRVHLRREAPGFSERDPPLVIQLGTPEAFEAKLEQLQIELGVPALDHVPIQYVNESNLLMELLPYLPSLLLLIPLIFAARSMSGGMGGPSGGKGGRNMFNIGKAFPHGQKDLKSKVKFTDVAGLKQAKQEVVEFVDFLKNPSKFEHLGARVPKGGLLVGPPGTGKTLLAKAVAGEADCPLFAMSGSEFVEMYVGVGPSRVRDLFAQARAAAPSIIFIDEIDAVGRKRGGGGSSGGGNDESENTLNQMLVEMDGFSSGTGVVVLAGTNRADILDPALKRPGRFDRQIALDRPDLNERQDIFLVHLKPVTLSADLDSESVARRMAALTPGFAGSDIANICNEAAIFAARRNATAVEMVDFERATERVLGGLPKQNNLMSSKQKRAVALHESGHAVAGWFLEHSDPLLKVSIVPRSSGALGFAQYLPEEISLYSKDAILDKIAVSLGGRAAEDLFVGRISTGASDDLDKVTKMAYAMVAVYGMNPELGLLSYSQNNSSEQFYKPYSEETGQLIDREARNIVDEQYERVKALLLANKDVLMSMADALAEKETLVFSDLRALLGEMPYPIKGQYSSFVTASGEHSAEIPVADEAQKAGTTEAEANVVTVNLKETEASTSKA